MAGITEVQIFGLRKSQSTRAAERFFKERRVKIHMVDLEERPIAPGELKRFVDKFGWNGVLDIGSKVYQDAGLEYLRVSEMGMVAKVVAEPRLLLLPFVRAGKALSVGRDEDTWKSWL
ncbi:MAG: arsenate reductase [Pleurocapsa sp. SU_196_0]|nr:arsenate reductase [Pleurocapsa sp. SU_196_0]